MALPILVPHCEYAFTTNCQTGKTLAHGASLPKKFWATIGPTLQQTCISGNSGSVRPTPLGPIACPDKIHGQNQDTNRQTYKFLHDHNSLVEFNIKVPMGNVPVKVQVVPKHSLK
jgi:hypothetical protein